MRNSAQWGGWLREGGNPNSTESTMGAIPETAMLHTPTCRLQAGEQGCRNLQGSISSDKSLVVQALPDATVDGMSAKLLHDPEVPALQC